MMTLKKIITGLTVLMLVGSLIGGWSLLMFSILETAIMTGSFTMLALVLGIGAVTGLFVHSIIEKYK